MTVMIDMHEDYKARFEPFHTKRSSSEPAWLLDQRKQAMGRFAELGLPKTKHEDWKWTSIAPLTKLGLQEATPGVGASPADVKPFEFEGLATARIVLVNGHIDASLSDLADLPAGVTVCPLTEAVTTHEATVKPHLGVIAPFDERAFVALNTALWTDGVFIHVPENVTLEVPIHIVHLTSTSGGPIVSHDRVLIVMERGSKATVIETQAGIGTGAYLANPLCEVSVADSAELRHYRLQRQTDDGNEMGITAIREGAASQYDSTTAHLGGNLIRNESHVWLGGEGADVKLNALSLGQRKQTIDNHTRLEHAMPNCTSWQMFKGILDDRSRCVFDGKIHVHQIAQKTDAKQTSRNLLLSDDAISNNKPQLEIYADDVKCTHGATTGQLDPEAVFYLRARGLDEKAAMSLLIYAFAGEVANEIHLDPVRKTVEREFLSRLPLGGEVLHAL
jgi:Fe-S cluster assembly protein SufD